MFRLSSILLVDRIFLPGIGYHRVILRELRFLPSRIYLY